jgi:hypothetical protein
LSWQQCLHVHLFVMNSHGIHIVNTSVTTRRWSTRRHPRRRHPRRRHLYRWEHAWLAMSPQRGRLGTASALTRTRFVPLSTRLCPQRKPCATRIVTTSHRVGAWVFPELNIGFIQHLSTNGANGTHMIGIVVHMRSLSSRLWVQTNPARANPLGRLQQPPITDRRRPAPRVAPASTRAGLTATPAPLALQASTRPTLALVFALAVTLASTRPALAMVLANPAQPASTRPAGALVLALLALPALPSASTVRTVVAPPLVTQPPARSTAAPTSPAAAA